MFSLLEDELRLPGKSDEGYTAKLNKVIQAYAMQAEEDAFSDDAANGECLCVRGCNVVVCAAAPCVYNGVVCTNGVVCATVACEQRRCLLTFAGLP